MSKTYERIGLIFMATGTLHTLLGIILFGSQLASIFSAGLIDGIDKHYDRGFAFWFVFAGLLMITLGSLMNWIVKEKQIVLPKSFGYTLIGICVVGVIVMPIGGFGLVLLQGVYIVAYATKHQVTVEASRL